MTPGETLAVALEVGREAAELCKKGWGHVTSIRTKGSHKDLVTEWDVRVEKLITERLAALCPESTVVGEELGESGHGEGQWLVDPIDGTMNFAHGLPLFAVSIGFARAGRLEAGVVMAPALGWEFTAARGLGAKMNGEPMQVSVTATLRDSLLVTGFPYDRATSKHNNLAQFAELQRLSGAVRRLGSASLDLCMVARGWFDGYWEYKLKPWDLAAGVLLVEEAGGRVTAPSCGPFDLASGEVAASNGKIHDEMCVGLAAVGGIP